MFCNIKESIEEEVKDITEAFTSARASASFGDEDLVDLGQDEEEDDDDDDDDVEDGEGDHGTAEPEPAVENEPVKLISVRTGSKESVGDKERAKAGIMTTNRKVIFRILWTGHELNTLFQHSRY